MYARLNRVLIINLRGTSQPSSFFELRRVMSEGSALQLFVVGSSLATYRREWTLRNGRGPALRIGVNLAIWRATFHRCRAVYSL